MQRFNWQAFVYALVVSALTALGIRVVPPGGSQPAPPTNDPPPLVTPSPAVDPLEALGRLVMPNGFCSATPVTPPNAEGHQRLLSAAHCVKRLGEECQFFTRAGRMVRCQVISINREADACVLETEALKTPLPYLLVAKETPPVGAVVMHSGFGVDKPGNVEKGRVVQQDTGNQQAKFLLSVSPGDSGGGICLDASGALVSPVCCTTRLAGLGDVFGARPEVVHRMLAQPSQFVDLQPVPMPLRMD